MESAIIHLRPSTACTDAHPRPATGPPAPGSALTLCLLPAASVFAQDGATTLDSIQVSGSWLGTGLHDSVKRFAGARTVVDRQRIEASGAASIGDAMRRIPACRSPTTPVRPAARSR